MSCSEPAKRSADSYHTNTEANTSPIITQCQRFWMKNSFALQMMTTHEKQRDPAFQKLASTPMPLSEWYNKYKGRTEHQMDSKIPVTSQPQNFMVVKCSERMHAL